MGKIIFTIVLVTIILALGIGEQVFMQKAFDDLVERCEEIQQLLIDKDYSAARKAVLQTKEWWAGKRNILEFTCPNNDIKDIYKEIGELEGTLYSEMYDDSITRTNVIKSMAENSKNLLAYRIKNIL
ncbi:MAG: DUF4363 family protein [Clostridia bacterium]|nr:DUF4363 family protein [Clostridia bacterium]MDE6605333.1 DUF4363 family protein [Clostridia bacterium]MDE6869457.1 DUF4363 family protein [Clostridia bacterium]MDE7208248.1 DUF4363 family protein [Clostridia bacterium]